MFSLLRQYLDRPNQHQGGRSTSRAFLVFEDDGMIQMLKQEIAACKVAAENVSTEQDRIGGGYGKAFPRGGKLPRS